MGEWSDAWRQLLPIGVTDDDRQALRREEQGAAMHRAGRVGDVRVASGFAVAQVQGSRATPYAVEIEVPTLGDAAWAVVTEVLAAEHRHGAALLAGHPPEGLIAALAARGLTLFPAAGEVDALCPCTSPSPCPHLVAVWEAVGQAFEDDPFVFFQLRGRGRERLLAEVAAARRSGRPGGDDGTVALSDLDASAWTRASAPLADLARRWPGARRVEPAPVLALLGDPPGWPSGADSPSAVFGPLIQRADAHLQTRLDPPSDADRTD